MEPKSPSKLKLSIKGVTHYSRGLKTSIIIFVVVLLSIGVYFAFNPGKGGSIVEASYFIVVVDCGSTGTRVNVYEWMVGGLSNMHFPLLLHSYPDNMNKSLLWRNSCQYHCMQTEPGLDKHVGNFSGVRASLEPLLTWAEQVVPQERHGETPIFVLGTAGLRRLTIEKARLLLEDVEAVVKDHMFLYKKSWIRVLSGKEEAYYGWVALNYKMGSFKNDSRSPTLGLLDLGGSSLQVVMEIDDAREDLDLVTSKIGSMEYKILANSFPGFGLNEAFDRSVVMLSRAQWSSTNMDNTLEVRHPCLGSDFVQNYSCSGCIGLNATKLKKFSQTWNVEFPTFHLVGDPNWERCKEVARAAATISSSLDWSQPAVVTNSKVISSSNGGSGIINLTAFTDHSTRFHALSGFFAVYNTLNLSPRANLTKIWEEGQRLCSRSWANMSSISSNHCFRVPYMAALIEDALCLGDKEIVFGPGDVSWTLGAALVEGKHLFLRASKSRTSISTLNNMFISSPVVLFLLLLCLLFIIYHFRVKLPMPSKKNATAGVSLPSYTHPKCRPK